MALIEAAKFGNLDKVKHLIDNGADIDEKDIYDQTALIYSVINRHFDIIKYLIEKGADIHYRNTKGGTAIICAAFKGYTGIIKYLIEHGANVNDEDNLNRSVIFFTDNLKHSDVVKYLIEKGADFNEIDLLKIYDLSSWLNEWYDKGLFKLVYEISLKYPIDADIKRSVTKIYLNNNLMYKNLHQNTQYDIEFVKFY